MPEDVLALLDVIGVRGIVVDDLGWDALLLPHYGLVLLDSEALTDDAEKVTDWILAEAAAGLKG